MNGEEGTQENASPALTAAARTDLEESDMFQTVL